ncbi:DUF3566 domain-containing protein [Streptomyces clavuligerus]|uniref:Integral membrane protein n=1 Tax=Streptomyces clavuligerus TaxID=1901 RepID=B5H358_STRCL|nr:DUF3566 domain-containing protein [Streptomyces clavuligerus]ANW19249.1 hypothetical protein BB341_13990 [Streptomyces clavuligerus]AXU13847.1 DUF3566 domain-containing protein [Streptomyces clavuligerus]EDY53004.1 conserved hypothetical protein [Streptomyces clavuligerus]EFG07989.1 Integral membrane protein [Streptomyces clavuligerus]MBY6303816.1 DUF3566 domain-containing protein [Streptomyces clavuligerus]
MSGATGAGSAAGAAGAAGKNGARGSAADSQGGTATETRGPKTPFDKPKPAAGAGATGPAAPKPAAGQPYRPPQAYQAPHADEAESAMRLARTGAKTTPRTRKARLRVAKADPWSVMKVSFLISIALGICTIIAAAVLWMVMDAMGVFSTVGGTISEATGSNENNGFDLQSFLSLPRVLIFTSVVAVIDVVLATALATLGAFIYNLSAGFVGGVELTLAEDE